MNLLIDTSVWSLALRRDKQPATAEVSRLKVALDSGEEIFSTGIILQELLQGFNGPKFREQIVSHFAALPFIIPDNEDHLFAAEMHTACRRRGIQAGTIDFLLAALCARHSLVMLSADADFRRIAAVSKFSVWTS